MRPDLRATGRKFLAALGRLGACGLALLIGAGLFGQVARDRSVPLALLMYLPIAPLGLGALAWDLARAGRALPRLRFGLAGVGAIGFVCGAWPMIGFGPRVEGKVGGVKITVLHWNVLWGGGPGRDPTTWKAQREEILRRGADLSILSEAPPGDWLDRLVDDLGPDGRCVRVEHPPTSHYWYRPAVVSRWPIRLEGAVALPDGAGMVVAAEVRGRPLRILVVDGMSHPLRSRTPFLRGVAAICREAGRIGRPFDLVVGDFNSPSRCLGFDAIAAQGYRLAGRSTLGWRGTFPVPLPWLDIDHIWTARQHAIRSCTFFRGPYSDHRGAVVRLSCGFPTRKSHSGPPKKGSPRT